MHPAVFINRASGSGEFANEDHMAQLRQIFLSSSHKAEVRAVDPEHLDSAIKNALDGPFDTLIVGGGDGSITSTADLVSRAGKTLGVIPLGTLNLEARDLGLSLEPLEAARQLAHATPVEIDLLRINERACLCALILGFYPALAKMRSDYHGDAWWQKSLRTAYETVVLSTHTPILRLTLETDSGTISRDTRLTAICPGSYSDEFGLIPTRDDLASGKIHAYVSTHLSRSELLAASMRFLTGHLLATDDMEVLTGSELTISSSKAFKLPVMIDGENLQLDLPIHIKIEHRALSVLIP